MTLQPVATESMFITGVMEAQKNREVTLFVFLGDFLHAKNDRCEIF